MLRNSFFFALAFLFAILTPTDSIAIVTGRTVNMVEYGSGSQRLGNFRQKSATTWTEQNASNQTKFTFEEQNRDDWSVYLYDASRKVHIQLDLHTKKVMYSDPQSPRREQYSIVNSLDKVNGYLASAVTYNFNNGKPLGEFIQTGPKTWKEQSFKGDGKFTFQEQNRDEWSVYLYDASRKVHIQLDLHTRKVMYSDPKSPRREQYSIASASGKVNGNLANEVIYSNRKNGNATGSFRKTNGNNWEEKNKDGTHKFVEVGRDDWSVYLKDASRKVEIQLDMHTEKVMYNVTQKPQSQLYTIIKVK